MNNNEAFISVAKRPSGYGAVAVSVLVERRRIVYRNELLTGQGEEAVQIARRELLDNHIH